jgi:hypothetical protein
VAEEGNEREEMVRKGTRKARRRRSSGEWPVPRRPDASELRFAARAVVAHLPESRAAGARCLFDGRVFPCKWFRWGFRVLTANGVSARQIRDVLGVSVSVSLAPRGRR